MATCNAVKMSCEDEMDKQNSSNRHSSSDIGNFVNNDIPNESKTDSEFAAQPVLSRSKRKRKRSKKNVDSSGVTNEVTVSVADLDLPGTEGNALMPENQSDSARCPSAIIVHKQNATSTLKDDSIGSGTNSCHDSLVEINAKTGPEFAAQPVLSKAKRKRIAKLNKKKFNSSGVTNEVTVSVADLDLPGTEGSALIPEKQSDSPRSPSAIIVHKQNGPSTLKDDSIGKNAHDSLFEINAKTDSEFAEQPVLSGSKRKRKRSKKKVDSSGVTNEVTVSVADLALPGTEGNALMLENQSDSARCPSAIIVHKQNATPTLKDDSVGTNSCHDSLVEVNAKPGPEFAAQPVLSKAKRKRIAKLNKKKFNSSGVTNEITVSLADLGSPRTGGSALIPEKQSDSPRSPSAIIVHKQNGTSTLKDDSIGTNSCHDCLVEINAKTGPEFAAQPVLSKTKRKRIERLNKKKFNSSGVTNEITVSLADLGLPGTGGSALIPEKQSDPPRSPSAIIVHKQNGTSMLKDDSIGKNACHDSLFEINAKTGPEFAAQPVLSGSKRKRKSKKKVDSSGVTNEVAVSVADLDLPGTEGNALMPENERDSARCPSAIIVHKQNATSTLKDDSIGSGTNSCHDSLVEINAKTGPEFAAQPVLSKAKRKRIAKSNKKKFNSSGVTNEITVSLADLGLPGTGGSALIPEKQSDSARSPSAIIGHKQNGTSTLKDDSIGKNACHDSLFEINAKTDFEFAAQPVLSGSKRKRKGSKKKVDSSGVTNEVTVSVADLDLPGTEGNALMPENQSDSARCPSAIIVHKQNATSTLKDDSIGTNSCHDSLVEVNAKPGPEFAAQPVLSQAKRKRMNKKKKVDSSGVTNEVTVSVADLGLPGTEGNALIPEKNTVLDVSIEKHNFQQVAHPLVGAPVQYADKKLLILDLNGLLADIGPSPCLRKADITISQKAVFKRPFCDDFLQFCFEKFNVGVWSSRMKYSSTYKKNVDQVVNFLMADSRHKLLFCWDQFHCTDTGFTTVENSKKPLVLKELKNLWDKLKPGLPWNKGDYNESNTLLLDDSPYKALCNPENTAIFPYPYSYMDAGDSSLGPGGDLRVYLEKLAEAQNVQEFIAHNPFGQQAITDKSPKWDDLYQKIVRHEFHKKNIRRNYYTRTS